MVFWFARLPQVAKILLDVDGLKAERSLRHRVIFSIAHMLPRSKRITRSDFPALLHGQARSFHSAHFSIRVKKLETVTLPGHSRFSFVVSKKVSKMAVVRNTLKRKMSAVVEGILSSNVTGLPASLSAVFAKKGAERLSYKNMKTELEHLYVEAGVVKAQSLR